MAAGIVGKALIVAWSFTLSNLGPIAQVVNLGPAPTDTNYVPVEMVINLHGATENDASGLMISFGTSAKIPTNTYHHQHVRSTIT